MRDKVTLIQPTSIKWSQTKLGMNERLQLLLILMISPHLLLCLCAGSSESCLPLCLSASLPVMAAYMTAGLAGCLVAWLLAGHRRRLNVSTINSSTNSVRVPTLPNHLVPPSATQRPPLSPCCQPASLARLLATRPHAFFFECTHEMPTFFWYLADLVMQVCCFTHHQDQSEWKPALLGAWRSHGLRATTCTTLEQQRQPYLLCPNYIFNKIIEVCIDIESGWLINSELVHDWSIKCSNLVLRYTFYVV